MSQKIEMKDGKVHVTLQTGLDKDKDGNMSLEADMVLKLNPAELINEIAKKDMALLEAILKQVKA